ncbi:hypothetical protein [Halomonas salifodinae]|uniref:hypothetical protein n=1 Tax=Halomonas salifodinae TaxID=438745 RepID=UPI0031F86217
MLYQVAVRVGSEIFRNPLQTVKKVPGVDLNKALNADIADIRLIAVQAIADIAVLFDIFAARALIEFLTDLHGDE